jgi:hypothetical protein
MMGNPYSYLFAAYIEHLLSSQKGPQNKHIRTGDKPFYKSKLAIVKRTILSYLGDMMAEQGKMPFVPFPRKTAEILYALFARKGTPDGPTRVGGKGHESPFAKDLTGPFQNAGIRIPGHYILNHDTPVYQKCFFLYRMGCVHKLNSGRRVSIKAENKKPRFHMKTGQKVAQC